MPKEKLKKTTDKESDYFVKRVHFWQEKLNLMNWRIDVYTKDLNKKDRSAEVNIDFTARYAVIFLAEKLPDTFVWNNKKLDRSAFHECCEILLSQLGVMAEQRYAKALVDEETHAIIRTLENAIVPKIRGKL